MIKVHVECNWGPFDIDPFPAMCLVTPRGQLRRRD